MISESELLRLFTVAGALEKHASELRQRVETLLETTRAKLVELNEGDPRHRFDQQPEPLTLFCHVQKCAGNTLRQVLQQNYDLTLQVNEAHHIAWTVEHWLKKKPRHERDAFIAEVCAQELVMGHFPFGFHELLPRPCRYITMLRHPLDRFLSLYEYLLTRSEWDNEKLGRLEDFCQNDYALELKNNHYVRVFAGEDYFADVTIPLTEVAVQTAIDNLRQCAFVGLVEYFVESVNVMRRMFGWENVRHELKVNVNHERKLRDAQIPGHIQEMIEPHIELDRKIYQAAAQMFHARKPLKFEVRS